MVWAIWWEGGRSSFAVRRYCLNVQKVFDYSQLSWPMDTTVKHSLTPSFENRCQEERSKSASVSFFLSWLPLSFLLSFSSFKAKIGLKLNIQKTKIMASGPTTSLEIDGETVETVSDFVFLGSKITVDGDCSHEIKRCFILGRKAMINLDSILKNRDITLLTKVHIVKAMVFPVVTYEYESWTIKKAEYQRNDDLWCWRRLSRVFSNITVQKHQFFDVQLSL